MTLAEAKQHLRVDEDYTEDDSYIQSLIYVARDYAEGIQQRALAVATYEMALDEFPKVKYPVSSYRPIKLPVTPVISVESITATLSDNSVMTLASNAYVVKRSGEIVPAYNTSWPTVTITTGDAVKIRFTAGYEPEQVPPSTKHALLLLIGHWYENRETVVVGKIPARVPLAAESLLNMDRRY